MKVLPKVPILLALLVVGIHVDQRLDRYEVGVGEEATVMLSLSNLGDSLLDISVRPDLPGGVASTSPDLRSVKLSPGGDQTITYPLKGVAPGNYSIASLVVYIDEGGTSRQVRCGDKYNRMFRVA
jgi:hypothetical protein